MDFESLKESAREQLCTKAPFEIAKDYAYRYIDSLASKRVYPDGEALAGLKAFDGPLPEGPASPEEILGLLYRHGQAATVAATGEKYFGFVNGSSFPAAVAARWMGDVWDQNAALYVMSPIAAKLEEVCESWIVELLGLPPGTAAGFVGGSSTATFCALAAARDALLLKQGWDARENGLFGAPPIRVVLGEQAHSSVFKALSLLGLGRGRVETVPADSQGRMMADKVPKLDAGTLLIAQAGNVNSGAFDPMDRLCAMKNEAGAWMHVDGAFGLWAAASREKRRLTEGFENADSWSADAHKTLNAPYDVGIVLVKDREALTGAMQAAGAYLQLSSRRDNMMYVPDMSRRARGIELWATLKCLGKTGVGGLVDALCANAVYFAQKLSESGFTIANDVVFNQVLVKCRTAEETRATLANIQESGILWCGGTTWQNEPAIRVSVCSWQTSRQAVDACVDAFVQAREAAI